MINDSSLRSSGRTLLVGVSGVSRYAAELNQTIQAFAQGSADVVVVGEPGSGKRFIARMINQVASSKPDSFISIGPHIGDDELRVILFDEERERIEGMLGRGIPRLTGDSTVYVKNVHELSIISQTRIFRFLMQRTPGRITSRPRARVIFGLSRRWSEVVNLRQVIESLSTFVGGLPGVDLLPLRQRGEDVPALVSDILAEIHEGREPALKVEPETMKRLMEHPWQDNIRELKAVLQDAVALSSADVLQLPPTFFDEISGVQEIVRGLLAGKKCQLEQSMKLIEQTLIRRALTQTGNDRAKAARLLGMSDANLRYRLRKQKFALPPQANSRSRRS